MRSLRLRPLRIAVAAALAAIAIPTDAFACWSLCVETYGYYRTINGGAFSLDHCVQSWPDGSRTTVTTCYYRRIHTY